MTQAAASRVTAPTMNPHVLFDLVKAGKRRASPSLTGLSGMFALRSELIAQLPTQKINYCWAKGGMLHTITSATVFSGYQAKNKTR